MSAKPSSGVPIEGRGAWIVPRRLTVGLLLFALAPLATVTVSKIVQHWTGEFDRARRALKADELPRAPAAGFTLPARGGGTLDLAQLKGKVVLVNFWATWCPPCRTEEPSLRELARRLSPESFQLVAVSVDDDWDPVDKYFGGGKPPYLVALDRGAAVSRAWGTTRFPESYLVDAGGNLRLKFVGARDWTDANVLKMLRSLGARRAP